MYSGVWVLRQKVGQCELSSVDRHQESHQTVFLLGQDVLEVMALVLDEVVLIYSSFVDIDLLTFGIKNASKVVV